MYIRIYQLDKEYQDAVLEMGGKVNWTNGDGDIDVAFSSECGVGLVTMDNDCVGFTNPKKNVGFVASSEEFSSIEIF